MFPYEREIYMFLMKQHIEKEKEEYDNLSQKSEGF